MVLFSYLLSLRYYFTFDVIILYIFFVMVNIKIVIIFNVFLLYVNPLEIVMKLGELMFITLHDKHVMNDYVVVNVMHDYVVVNVLVVTTRRR